MTITAVFGIDDSTEATLDCAEAGDICAMVGLNTAAAVIGPTESADGVAIAGLMTLLANLPAAEFADACAIGGSVLIVANIAISEHADTCGIAVIAPTSIIGHGKKYHVKPHDPKSIVPAS